MTEVATDLNDAVALGYVAIVACNGIDDVALVFLATDTLGGGAGAVGLLLAAVGIGLLAGYALLARSRRQVALPALLLAGFAVSSAGNLLTGLTWAVAAAFTLQALIYPLGAHWIFGGGWLALFTWQLSKRPLIPINDPQFESFAALLPDAPERDLLRAQFLTAGGAPGQEGTREGCDQQHSQLHCAITSLMSSGTWFGAASPTV